MSKHIRVGIVAHNVVGAGGMETQLRALIAGLREYYEIWLYTADPTSSEVAVDKWIRISTPKKPFVIKYLWFALFGSLRLKLRHPDVVISTGAIVWRKADINVVHYVHASVARRGNPRRLYSRGWRHADAWLNEKISVLMERFIYRTRFSRCLVGVSAGVVADLQRDFKSVQLPPIELIPNGVDVTHYGTVRDTVPLRAELEIPPDATVVLFVGGDWKSKGLPILLEAFKGMKAHYKERVHLVVVGEGNPKEMGAWLEGHVNVSYVGAQRDVAPWYKMADIFAFPSRYETFGLVVFEAAAAGMAIVTTNVGMIGDIIINGESGIVADERPESWTMALEQLVDDTKYRRHLAGEAQRRAANFGWGPVIAQYRDLIETLVATNQAATLRGDRG